MRDFFKALNRTFTKWSLGFPPFGFLYFHSLYFCDRIITYFYCKKQLSPGDFINSQVGKLNDPEVLDVISVAFNNSQVIEWQIKFLRKNLQDKFVFTVADNSQSEPAAAAIKAICQKYQIAYFRLPKNPYSGTFPSWSHGLSLNWIYKNYLRPRGARYFGFLDHDIFPIRPLSILPRLQEHLIYGTIQRRQEVWWPWPGFCFFRSELFINRPVNFSTSPVYKGFNPTFVDTGGGNWKAIFAKMKSQEVAEAVHYLAFLNSAEERDKSGKLYSWTGGLKELIAKFDTSRLGEDDKFIEFIDGWLHIRKIGYSGEADTKLKLDLLDSFSKGAIEPS